MTIQTSYFSSNAPNPRKVCIAKKAPRFLPGLLHIPELAPSNPWAKGDWRSRYRADIQTRFPDPRILQALLLSIQAKVGNPILCCYEKDRRECHRGILAEIIEQELGISCPEWPGV